MFGPIKRALGIESRSRIDAGQLYGAFFAYGGTVYGWQSSPAVLAASLSTADGPGAFYLEAERLARISPLLRSYTRCMTGGVMTGEEERPEFSEVVSERVAEGAADLWESRHDVSFEADALYHVMVTGECLLLDSGEIVPAREYEPVPSGPAWSQTISGYKIGQGSTLRRDGLMYVGDRRRGDLRAEPWIGAALPYISGLTNARVASAHGLGALAKMASTIKNVSSDRVTASAGARRGVVDSSGTADPAHEPVHTTAVGSIPYMRPGEEFARPEAGPDKTAQDYEALLEADISAALNLPLSELKSDYRTGSFSNLQMAHADATAEYTRRRVWWHRNFRRPIWRTMLSEAFADGALPRMRREEMEALKKPTWPGPVRISPQPAKDALAYAKLVEAGVIDAATAAEKLEV